MGVIVTHSRVTGAPADPNALVDGPAWDAQHAISGLAPSATVDATNANNITSGTLSAARLPAPTSSALGGVKSLAAASHQFLTQIDTTGQPAQAQPAFTDLSGNATIAQGGTGQTTASAAFDALAPTTTQGDIIFRNASTNARLAAGTSGFLLQSNGAGTNPSYAGFLQSGSGAVTRTWQAKARDQFNVKDFGAVGDGSTDDSAAIINAISAASTAGGGAVVFGNGTFVISSLLNLPSNVSLVGQGPTQTTLLTSNATLTFISINGFYNAVRGFSFNNSSTPSNGAIISVASSAFTWSVQDIQILNCYYGIVAVGTSNANTLQIGFLDNIRIYNWRGTAMFLQYVNDVFMTNFLFFQKDVTLTSGGSAFVMRDKCEAVCFTNGDIVGGSNSLDANATTNSQGTRPAHNSFTNVYFDTTVNGSTMTSCYNNVFSGCWFSTGGLGGVTTANSLNINAGCDTNCFSNCRFMTAPQHGCVVYVGAVRTSFVNCTFRDNSVLAGSGVGHGLTLGNSVTNVEVIGGSTGNAGIGAQGYGIAMGTSLVNVRLIGVDLNANTTGALSNGTGITSTVTVTDCSGYVTYNRGTGTVPNTGASVAIAHGLSGTPTTVVCTMLDTGGGAQAVGSNIPRVLSVGGTNFTYDIGVVATANRPFSWEARL